MYIVGGNRQRRAAIEAVMKARDRELQREEIRPELVEMASLLVLWESSSMPLWALSELEKHSIATLLGQLAAQYRSPVLVKALLRLLKSPA